MHSHIIVALCSAISIAGPPASPVPTTVAAPDLEKESVLERVNEMFLAPNSLVGVTAEPLFLRGSRTMRCEAGSNAVRRKQCYR